ncbi:ABC transporter permease [Streptomyces sp. MP131-18]|uniref:ABC transporter permease n=1 Tax=Streptomyces sp. MP131-18 TaxID=1857892 RepID=UPI00097C55EB|nr:ABC transporter permease [Streptomyces sp. MP131-18]ONK11142.1 ABC-type transport system involved in multi-copper enzyme maturation, permease component [Streptomyces sp. MP131-18]
MAHTGWVLTSEWTKIRSVRSTLWTLAAALVVTVALGMLISFLVRQSYDDLSREERLTFDPTFISFAGTSLGQLAMIAFGILVVSNEYSTGMIRASLTAVPQRGVLMGAKLVIATALALLVGMLTSFLTFFLGQAMLGDHRTDLGEPGVLRAVFGGGLYMGLIALFAMGVTWMLRSPMLSFGVLIPFFFMISSILANVEATEKIGDYLPDQAGSRIMAVIDDGERPYGPWTGLLIMLAWVAASLLAGYVVLKRRDA